MNSLDSFSIKNVYSRKKYFCRAMFSRFWNIIIKNFTRLSKQHAIIIFLNRASIMELYLWSLLSLSLKLEIHLCYFGKLLVYWFEFDYNVLKFNSFINSVGNVEIADLNTWLFFKLHEYISLDNPIKFAILALFFKHRKVQFFKRVWCWFVFSIFLPFEGEFDMNVWLPSLCFRNDHREIWILRAWIINDFA